MIRRTLREGTKQVHGRPIPWNLTYTDECGFECIYEGEISNHVATKEQYQWAICAQNALAIQEHTSKPKTIAHLGGGFCLLARILGPDYQQTIYELEPALEEWCPNYCTFVAGDWQDTLTGTYDVIVYDIGDQPDRALLTAHLAPSGLLLGVD